MGKYKDIARQMKRGVNWVPPQFRT